MIRRIVQARRRPRRESSPPTPHPSPAWGCCGCGAAQADVLSLAKVPAGPLAGQPCDETYCWGCVSRFHPGVRYEVFTGRERRSGGGR
jgi:hypothetical protein